MNLYDRLLEEVLVLRAQVGDRDALRELIERYRRPLRYFIRGLSGESKAEDVFQETWLAVIRKIYTLKEPGAFPVWLYRIARNHLIDEIRKLKRRPSIDTDVIEVFLPSNDRSESYLERQELMAYIDNLPENQRQVVLLKFIEGLNNEEISQVMGKSQGAIRILQMRALDNLRKDMGGE